MLRFLRSQGAVPLPFDDVSGSSPPSAFGNYRVLHQIGSGVLGPVFRAYDSQSDRLVAIKTFRLDLIPEDAAKLADRLRRLAAQPPSHPAIVGSIDAGLQGSRPFIVLEYASGESLDVVLRQSGAAPLSRALPLLREIARAIDASWTSGIGHGALHPRDIFVTPGTTDVRITGFGSGQALDAVGSKAPVRRPYSAPERASGSAWDARADVYAFAVIAGEMLSGYEVGGQDAPLRRVLTAATADNPADRYATAGAFVDALADAGEQPAGVVDAPDAGAGIGAVGETPSAPPPKLSTSRPRPVVLDLPVAMAREREPGPKPEPKPEPRVRPEPPRFAPRLSIEIDEPIASAPERHANETHAFPWAAIAAVLAAGVVLGAAVAYQVGWSRGHQAATSAAAAASPSAGATDAAPAPPAPASVPGATPEVSVAAADPTRPVTQPSAPPGRLVIQSVPSGALVTVDGRRAGETPVTVQVPLGRHEIQIARSGYVPKFERVNLTARTASLTVRVQLRRGAGSVVPGTAATGSVDVDSRPRGARVTIDGRPLGLTPLRVPELTAGDHRIQFDLDGHRAVTSTLSVVAGELTRFAVTLEQGGPRLASDRRIVR